METTGSQTIKEDEFHLMMEKMYSEQGPLHDKEGNDYYVASKLPGPLFAKFYALCKARKWNRSTGVKYAIHHLINEIK